MWFFHVQRERHDICREVFSHQMSYVPQIFPLFRGKIEERDLLCKKKIVHSPMENLSRQIGSLRTLSHDDCLINLVEVVTAPSPKGEGFQGLTQALLPQSQKNLTVCLEELVSASSVNCMRHYSKLAHFIPALKCWVFMRPLDKKC